MEATNPDPIKEHALNIAVAMFVAAFSILFTFYYLPGEVQIAVAPNRTVPLYPTPVRVALSLCHGFLWGFFSWIATEQYKRYARRQQTEEQFVRVLETKLDTMLKPIQERLGNLIEHSAFYTTDQKLEDAINSLRSTQGKRVWIVAKFISKQLSDTFSELKVQISGDDYSSFAATLYPECETSIYLTSPFTPRQWFDQLLKGSHIQRIREGRQLEATEIPEHVRGLLASPAPTKRRLVVLCDEAWKELTCAHPTDQPHTQACVEKRRFLEEFLRLSHDTGHSVIDTRFATESDVKRKVPGYEGSADYAIFDEQLSLKWTRPSAAEDAAATPLCLHARINDTERRLCRLFKFDWGEKILQSGEEILRALPRADELGRAADPGAG